MDRKGIIILVASVLLLLFWFPLMRRLYPPTPQPIHQTSGTTNSNAVVQGTNTAILRPATNLPVLLLPPLPVLLLPPVAVLATNAPEQLLTLEGEGARYQITSHGGGLKLVELTKYPEIIDRGNGKTNGVPIKLNARAPFPAMVLRGIGIDDGQVFALERSGDKSIRARKRLANGLEIEQEFRVGQNPSPGSEYLLDVTITLRNATNGPLTIGSANEGYRLETGSSTPLDLRDDGLQLGTMWHDGKDMNSVGESYYANRTLGCFPGTPLSEYAGGNSNITWTASYNRFFALAVFPTNSPQKLLYKKIILPPNSAEDRARDPRALNEQMAFQSTFIYPGIELGAGGVLTHQFTVYAGPREYQRLSKLGTRMKNEFELVMDYGGFFGWFAKALLWCMNQMHQTLSLGYGWAIVLITIIIKLLFWPLTAIGTKSMKRMGKLQPQMNALKEKYKDDPKKMNMKLMEFMKENKINPMGGCMPMLIQIPVFFGFFTMLRSAIELRGAEFLWICDLSQADTVYVIPGINFPINPMPILMGGTMIWQALITPPSPGMDPLQQKIMKYMPLMFMVFLYNFSAGLTLYWTVQNILTITQMKLTPADPEPTTTLAKA